ncbi:alkaline phosphatase [Psychromonas ossibalaenae]|uniref:alkaline phosphatase n=1 Tax=Psychromonas ossibalaenae TaxID=444922 RepID=UPI000367E5A4|nr:alkaline phosphatase [Psychromonas ossibalaenae]
MKRKIISMSLIVSTTLILAGCSSSKPEVVAQPQAKNVILLIGDGMGFGQLEMARLLEYGTEGSLNMQKMENFAAVTTYSADNVVTDSAAAGTAIATGTKTNNKSVGIDSASNDLESISEALQAQGKSIGLVATAGVYDATPATFGSSVKKRSDKGEIVRDYYDAGWDVILGGGTKYFAPKKQNGVDMIKEFKAKGYTYVTTADELANVTDTDKLLGLFNYDQMTFAIDRDEEDEITEEPTLKEMTMKALDVLSQNKDGFFLMSEGSEIDGAGHGGDAAWSWKSAIEFDEAIKYALDWAEEHGNTLVIVTADHETGAMMPTEVFGRNLEAVRSQKKSTTEMAYKLKLNEKGTEFTLESIKEALAYGGIEITDEETEVIQAKLNMEYVGDSLRYNDYMIGSFLADKFGYTFINQGHYDGGNTYGHTGTWVPLFAEGVGSEKFEGVINNTDIKGLILEATQ